MQGLVVGSSQINKKKINYTNKLLDFIFIFSKKYIDKQLNKKNSRTQHKIKVFYLDLSFSFLIQSYIIVNIFFNIYCSMLSSINLMKNTCNIFNSHFNFFQLKENISNAHIFCFTLKLTLIRRRTIKLSLDPIIHNEMQAWRLR